LYSKFVFIWRHDYQSISLLNSDWPLSWATDEPPRIAITFVTLFNAFSLTYFTIITKHYSYISKCTGKTFISRKTLVSCNCVITLCQCSIWH
jgi:hypothetical protein